MEWIFLGGAIAIFLGTIGILMLMMFSWPITRWVILAMGIAALVVTLILLGAKTIMWIAVGLGGGAIGLIIMVPIIVWFILAPSNRFFTFVEEGTAKIIVKAGKYHKALIQWQGYTFDDDWNVVPEGTQINGRTYRESWHPFGGLRFYGFWPLLDVYIYRLRWYDLHMSEEKDGRIEEVRFHDEIFDHVLVRPDVYWTKISKAETKPEERIPVDVEFLITMMVVNPRRVLFVAPINWVENVMARLDAMLRGFVANHSLNELIDLEGRGELIWQEIGGSELIQNVIKNEWGIEILENGIQLKDINMTAEYQEAAARERTEQMRAAGEVRRISAVYQAIQNFGELGKLVRTLEAMERSPEKGSRWVIPLPGMTELFRGVFGRPPEAVTPEEIRELRQIIEGIAEKLKRQEGR